MENKLIERNWNNFQKSCLHIEKTFRHILWFLQTINLHSSNFLSFYLIFIYLRFFDGVEIIFPIVVGATIFENVIDWVVDAVLTLLLSKCNKNEKQLVVAKAFFCRYCQAEQHQQEQQQQHQQQQQQQQQN